MSEGVPVTRPVSDFSRTPALPARLRAILETSPFPVFLVSLVGVVLLTVFGPSLVVGDTWLTLMAGREIVDHGLPQVEHVTLDGMVSAPPPAAGAENAPAPAPSAVPAGVPPG